MKSLYRPILTMLIPAFLVSCIESDNLSCVSTKLKLDIAEAETKTPFTGTSFPDGASLGVFLDGGDGSYDGISYNNIRYHKEGGKGFMLESDILLSGTTGTLYAYYPYSESVTDPSCIPVDISSQTDLMYASPVTGLNSSNPYAAIRMRHALCCLRLVFSKGSYRGEGRVTRISVRSEGLARTGIMDARTGGFISKEGTGSNYTVNVSFTLSDTEAFTQDLLLIPTGVSAPISISCVIDGRVFSTETIETALTAGSVSSYAISPGVTPVSIGCAEGSIITIWTKNDSIGTSDNLTFIATMSDGTTKLISPYHLEHHSSDESLAVMVLTQIEVGEGGSGTAVITTSYLENGVTVSCDTEIRVNNISMTTADPELDGSTSTTKVTVTDYNGITLDNPAVAWSQSGSGSVYFYQGQPKPSQQTVAPKTKGPVTVRADYEGELGASYITMDFKVISPVFSVFFTSPAKQALESGEDLTLAARAQGFMGSTVTTTLKDFEWHSSDESIATVHEGVVTGVKAGNVEITCECDGKRCSSPATITVWEASYSHSIGYQSPAGISSLTAASGETRQLDFWETKWCYLPDTGGTYPEYTKLTSETSWSSDNPSVATVDAGLVTTIAKGHATITATYEGIKRHCTIYVSQ